METAPRIQSGKKVLILYSVFKHRRRARPPEAGRSASNPPRDGACKEIRSLADPLSGEGAAIFFITGLFRPFPVQSDNAAFHELLHFAQYLPINT
jgi:hypothetical protein